MAKGARRSLGADLALAITGIAGPEPWKDSPWGASTLAWLDPTACWFATSQAAPIAWRTRRSPSRLPRRCGRPSSAAARLPGNLWRYR
ncbi:MAG: CinA family protein [Thermoflexus sp.]|nr:CinA family protein [Thermoflexus sp.]